MKLISKILVALVCSLGISGMVAAQKYAYVDTDYILENIPDYKAAQKQLNDISVKWQREIEEKMGELDKMYKDYRAEEILLSATQKKEREDAIVAKEDAMKQYEQDKFGVNGELFKKRQELVKPIQDKVFNAVKTIAQKGSYSAIFDISSELTILYISPKLDKSDAVLESLGYGTKNNSKSNNSKSNNKK